MKTSKELHAIKEEIETVSAKLHELSNDELEQVIGGCGAGINDSDTGVHGIIGKLLETAKELREKAAKGDAGRR